MDDFFYQVSQILLLPVLWSIYFAFIYSLFETGRFVASSIVRKKLSSFFKMIVRSVSTLATTSANNLQGYHILSFYIRKPSASLNDVEVFALRKLEKVKLVTRVAPMLGLIATLIPMGPALMAMTENNVVAMSEHLRTAFTAVVLALAAAAITFCIASIQRRWYAEEIVIIEKHLLEQKG